MDDEDDQRIFPEYFSCIDWTAKAMDFNNVLKVHIKFKAMMGTQYH